MDIYQAALTAASKAVTVAGNYLQDASVVSAKEKDIKTLADISMHEVITQELASTGIPVLSEESDRIPDDITGTCWIVDPLDGTFNFSRKYPVAAVSICLWQDGGPSFGIVHDIFNNTVYSAFPGKQTSRQETGIQVSMVVNIGEAILATGFPSGASYETEHVLRVVKSIQSFKKVRAIGSASLMLAQVAAGIFDVYYEKDIYLWDVAAGLSLVQNAGGKYYLRRNGATHKYEVLASNAMIFENAKQQLLF
jgi:myo-inositol-1(or 4)-monophosphatase